MEFFVRCEWMPHKSRYIATLRYVSIGRDLRLTIHRATLRRVAAWRRKGVLEAVYAELKRQGVDHPVKHLAQLTGIPAGNLSQINTGNRDMTDGYADRIVAAVPGITRLDLGAAAREDDLSDRRVLARLDELAKILGDSLEQQSKLERKVDRLQARIRRLEGHGEDGADAAKGPH